MWGLGKKACTQGELALSLAAPWAPQRAVRPRHSPALSSRFRPFSDGLPVAAPSSPPSLLQDRTSLHSGHL